MGYHASRKLALLLLLVSGLVLAMAGVSLAAETLTVAPGESIQDAIDEAGPGDTINVKTGTYTEDLRIYTGGLTLKAVDGPGTAEIVGDDSWN